MSTFSMSEHAQFPHLGSDGLAALLLLMRALEHSHYKLIREMGAASHVLLKNVNHTLPLKRPRNMVLVGSDAGPPPLGPNYYHDRFITPEDRTGVLAMGQHLPLADISSRLEDPTDVVVPAMFSARLGLWNVLLPLPHRSVERDPKTGAEVSHRVSESLADLRQSVLD
jgi:hypothetical protein